MQGNGDDGRVSGTVALGWISFSDVIGDRAMRNEYQFEKLRTLRLGREGGNI